MVTLPLSLLSHTHTHIAGRSKEWELSLGQQFGSVHSEGIEGCVAEGFLL